MFTNFFEEQNSKRVLEAIILETVLKEHRLQPRLGGKKLYFMLCDAIHEFDIHFGRDKFLAILVVKRKKKSKAADNQKKMLPLHFVFIILFLTI